MGATRRGRRRGGAAGRERRSVEPASRDGRSADAAAGRSPTSRAARRAPTPATPDPTDRRAVKLAVVVQRYGQAINGGAELHARYIAEHLARHADVEVLTTCATDYVTWRNELPAGVERVNGVPVRRFRGQARARSARVRPAVRARLRPAALARRRARLARRRRTDQPGARRATSAKHAADYDFCIFFSYRYYHAYHGARAAARRARSSCRPRSAIRRSACRSSSRSFAACAR